MISSTSASMVLTNGCIDTALHGFGVFSGGGAGELTVGVDAEGFPGVIGVASLPHDSDREASDFAAPCELLPPARCSRLCCFEDVVLPTGTLEFTSSTSGCMTQYTYNCIELYVPVPIQENERTFNSLGQLKVTVALTTKRDTIFLKRKCKGNVFLHTCLHCIPPGDIQAILLMVV